MTQEQISEYCNNNQILAIENEEEAAGPITVIFGVILIVVGLITTELVEYGFSNSHKKTKNRSIIIIIIRNEQEMMMTMNNRRIEEQQQQDDWSRPKKVLAYCMII